MSQDGSWSRMDAQVEFHPKDESMKIVHHNDGIRRLATLQGDA